MLIEPGQLHSKGNFGNYHEFVRQVLEEKLSLQFHQEQNTSKNKISFIQIGLKLFLLNFIHLKE